MKKGGYMRGNCGKIPIFQPTRSIYHVSRPREKGNDGENTIMEVDRVENGIKSII